MKSKTIATAIKLGFEFDNVVFDSEDELKDLIIDFLNDNQDKIKKTEKHFCEVSSNGRNQHVEFGNYSSSGEIVDWSFYYHKRKQRIYHSDFLEIKENGEVVKILLYCYSK